MISRKSTQLTEEIMDKNSAMMIGIPFIGIIVISALFGAWYTVPPNEVAYVTRFGSVISETPQSPGFHFKLPFIDSVDELPTSLTQLSIDPVTVNTLDNQAVTIGINVSYSIPRESVRKLLYEVGRSGNFDIVASVAPVVKDRALRVFAGHNTTKISEERNAIAQSMQNNVADRVKTMFGIEIVDLQITHLEYSKTFQDSVETAMNAKNLAIQAENETRRTQAQAEQTRIKADADAYAKKQNAEAEAYGIIKKTEALSQSPKLIDFTLAERWNGVLPTTMVPGGAVPFIDVGSKK